MSSNSTAIQAVPAQRLPHNESHPTSFKEILSGKKAFYNQPDYLEATGRDFAENKALPVNYTWNTESKIRRITKLVFSIIIFPIGIYKLLHALAGKLIVPASSTSLTRRSKNHARESRSWISLENERKHKRITVEVDGYKIDAMIVGKASTLGNGRWILVSNANNEFYENKLIYNYDFRQILSGVEGNAIVFNYPGVGASSGLPNRQAMAKAYRAMLTLLEDKKNGIGAKEIIGYGMSIGGGVQGDALKTHELKKGIKYVFIKDRTFSNLSKAASTLIFRPAGFLVKILGWNMDSVESSRKLQAPEIIMQAANVEDYEEIKDSIKVVGDRVITANASLAKALLEDGKCPKKNKIFIGMKKEHNSALALMGTSFLTTRVNALLKIR